MKKLLSTLLFGFALIISFHASAQYCGSARVSFPSCGIQQTYGFGDVNTYHCFTRGQNDTLVIPFKIFQSFTAGGNTVNIYKIRINNMDSLPSGLCWSTNQSATAGNGVNEFSPNESGCIQISGITTDCPGQYKLSITLAVRDNSDPSTWDNQGYNIDTIASDAGGISLWVKVVNPGTICPDTIITANGSMHPGNGASCPLGIQDISGSLSNLNIQPNPMSSEAKVTFSSEVAGNQQLRITNIVGSEVFSTTIAAKVGSNETTIQKNNLPTGIYILSIGGPQGIATRKFIITE